MNRTKSQAYELGLALTRRASRRNGTTRRARQCHVGSAPRRPEIARIEAWLLVTRYTVRDYLDTVVPLLKQPGRVGL